MGMVRKASARRLNLADRIDRNMFLAASPYFQHRFASDPRLLSTFSPSLLTISSVTNLVSMFILARQQASANYPYRVIVSLVLNTATFALLALSTVAFRSIPPSGYFAFLMTMVFFASLATGLCQNGVFAYVNAFNMPKYIQAIMTGQGIAGVLPCIAQIVSVLAVPPEDDTILPRQSAPPAARESGKSAFAYFLTAVPISLFTLLAFLLLTRRNPSTGTSAPPSTTKSSTVDPPPPPYESLNPSASFDPNDPDPDPSEDEHPSSRKTVPILTLYKKLHHLANAVVVTFIATMFFPVFTQRVTTAHPAPDIPRLLQPACFIPLAFLFWNLGDLSGRFLTLSATITRLTRYPKIILAMAVVRVVWLPLYELCKRGVVRSDLFYLVVVQFGFGVSNGLLGSLCMMGAGEWVEPGEREAAGGFMGMMLVAGLSLGSLASFTVT